MTGIWQTIDDKVYIYDKLYIEYTRTKQNKTQAQNSYIKIVEHTHRYTHK